MNDHTLSKLFFEKIKNNPSTQLLGNIVDDKINFFNGSQIIHIIKQLAFFFEQRGLAKNDKISILSQSNIEWHFCDMAAMCTGRVVIPIYPTYPADEIEYLINHSDSKMVIVEDEKQLNKLIKILDKIKQVHTIITLRPIKGEEVIPTFNYADIVNSDHHIDIEQIASQVTPQDIASIIYTSGTTGRPKGAIITHQAFFQMLENIKEKFLGVFTIKDRSFSFLPLSHVLGRCDSMLYMALGNHIIYAESISKMMKHLELVKPTLMISVPRIFEQVYSKSIKELDKFSNQLLRFLISKFIHYKISKKFGGKMRFFVSGGAPLSIDIINFFNRAGFTILEGYGLTETIAPCFVNPAHKQIAGSVGVALSDVECKINHDGEILIKTKAMFSGYYKNPVETDHALKDGWLYTGDNGKFTDDGYLMITDRKKDIIIMLSGKNVAPQKIEGMAKAQKYISNIMVIGNNRKHLVAIICIDQETITLAGIQDPEEIRKVIKKEIDLLNKKLADFEKIKDFYISPIDFNIDNGYLTPSLKLKKNKILKDFHREIDSMYK